MFPHNLRVAPGEVATGSIKVRNLGTVVDEVTLTVRRDVASWTSVAPDTLHIFPGTQAEATIRSAPPRAIHPLAGLYALEIAVNSDRQPNSSLVYRGSVEVGAYDSLTATPIGSTNLQARREAILPIKVRSQGNRPITAYIAADEMPGLTVSLSSSAIPLEPGGEATVWVTLRPRPKSTAQQNPYTISVSSDFAPPISIEGRLERPAPPNRGRALGMLLTGGAVLAGLAAVVVVTGLLSGHPSETPMATGARNLLALGSPSPAMLTPLATPAPLQPTASTLAILPTQSAQPTTQATLATLAPTPTQLAATTPQAPATPPPPTATPQPPPTTPLVATLIPPAIAWIDGGAQSYWKLQTDLTSNVFVDEGLTEPLDGGLSIDSQARRATWFFQRRDAPAQNWIRCSGQIDATETLLTADAELFSSGGWAAAPTELTGIEKSVCGWMEQVPLPAQPFRLSPFVGGGPGDFIDMTNDAFGVNMTWVPISNSLPGYQLCSLEGPDCLVDGNVQVAFGANGLFEFGNALGSVPCTNLAFGGDPDVNVLKACYAGPPVIGLVHIRP